MNKFKVCPTCGERNDPRSMECGSCGTDLIGVAVLDEDGLQKEKPASSDESAPQESDSTQLVRICTCGEINPSQARKCARCGEDISDIIPVPQPVEIQKHYQLSAVDGDYLYQIPCGTMIIGREHGMRECLAGKAYVSRAHAKLTVEDGNLYIENLSTTNYTYVNNIRISTDRTQLHSGDEVALGGIVINGSRQEDAAYFVVGVSP